MSSNDIFNVTLNAVGGKLKTSETGQMNIKVENYDGGSYHCRSVTIKVPVGDFAGAVYYNDNKTVFGQIVSGKSIPEGTEEKNNFISSTFNIDGSGERPLKTALEFTVKGNVNSKAGMADVTVSYEYSEDGKTFLTESKTLSVNKESDDIYLYNFHTEKPDAADVICTRFSRGASIRFAWESNADSYEVYAGSDLKPVYSGEETSFTYKSGISCDTTFTLKASKKVDGFSESILMETVAVDCLEPEISALTVENGLTVEGAASLKGGLKAEGTVTMLSKAVQLTGVSEKMGDKTYVTVQTDGDGFLTVYMECNSSSTNTRAHIRATAYRDKKSLIALQDDAYHVKVKCDENETVELVHCASMIIPVCSNDTCIINCNMLKPSQSKLASGYDLQIYFTPIGSGTAKLV